LAGSDTVSVKASHVVAPLHVGALDTGLGVGFETSNGPPVYVSVGLDSVIVPLEGVAADAAPDTSPSSMQPVSVVRSVLEIIATSAGF
jgi:hypothetical protein